MTAATEPLVLIAEDEPKLATLLRDYVESSSMRAMIVADGNDVGECIRQHQPDVVLLDIMLPNRDGMTICREVRAFSDVPIIMVTARVEEIDRLLGLELGADDYVCKPFSPREIVARIKAILRRVRMTQTNEPSGLELEIDDHRYRASINGQRLDLTPIEFRLLSALAKYPGRVYSRDRLLDQLHDDYRESSDRAIDSHIKNIRRKIGAVVPDRQIIFSVYGVGYKLELAD